ncbi:hypothetical protein QQ045_006815 [Rhodiola kirilowii]
MSDSPFKKGDAVEVMVEDNDGDDERPKIATWHSANVLKVTGGTKGKVFVQFTNLTSYENDHLRERVDYRRVRPVPPPARWWFKVGDRVEVLYDYGWRGAVVEEILEKSKYLVKVDGMAEATDVDQWRVRAFREWVDGSWVPDESHEQEKPGDMAMKSCQKIETMPRKLIVKFSGRETTAKMKFEIGARVEVSSDEPGYEGAYFTADVVGYAGNDRYLVEYLTLRTNDEKEALREEAEARHIRPYPCYRPRMDRYQRFEIVDCWYNEGWWKGEVLKVLGHHKYIIYFSTTLENLEFSHGDLRPHQEWMDGRWVSASTYKEVNQPPV